MDEQLQLTRTRAGQPEDSVIGTQSMLASAVTRFAKAWERTDSVPDLAEYLPVESELRSVILIELIKIDLEHRWLRVGRPKHLADYVDEFPELQTMSLPPDLLYEEYHCMRRKGVGVDPTQYPDNVRTELGSGEYRSTLIVQSGNPRCTREHHVGDRIGDFDLLLALGVGAFARVFLARQRSMERLVALKISHNHGSEPQMLAQLDHQYVVRVFDKQLLKDRDLKLMYMEYLPGGTMLELLRRGSRDTPGDAQRQAGGRIRRRRVGGECPTRERIGHSRAHRRLVVAGNRGMARPSARRGTRLLRRARRPASRHQAGERALDRGGRPEVGRLQHQLQQSHRRCQPSRLLRRLAGLHVARAVGGLPPGPAPPRQGPRRSQRHLRTRRDALGTTHRRASVRRRHRPPAVR